MDIPLGHSAFDPLCLYGEGDSAVNLHIPKTKKHLHYHLRLQLPTRLAVASKAASPTAHHPDLPIRIPSPPHTRASGSNRTHHPCMISIQLPRPTTSPQPFQTARTTSAYPTSPPHTRPLFPNPSSMKVFHVVARARARNARSEILGTRFDLGPRWLRELLIALGYHSDPTVLRRNAV